MTETQVSENEQMRRVIPNESNNLVSLQMSYQQHDISIHEPSMLNLSLPSSSVQNNMNLHNSMDVSLIFYNYFNDLFTKIVLLIRKS